MSHPHPKPDSPPTEQEKIEPGTTDEITGHSQAKRRAEGGEAMLPDGAQPAPRTGPDEWRPSDAAEEE